jgi:lysyl-tRNA synthetase class 1
VSVCHSEDPAVIWHYISRYSEGSTPENSPITDQLVGYAIRYYRDFVLPAKDYRQPTADEKVALADLRSALEALPHGVAAEDIQAAVYDVGKRHACFGSLKEWFQALYQILLGQDSGPRMGSFIALYGMNETLQLLGRAVEGADLSSD